VGPNAIDLRSGELYEALKVLTPAVIACRTFEGNLRAVPARELAGYTPPESPAPRESKTALTRDARAPARRENPNRKITERARGRENPGRQTTKARGILP